MVHGLLCLPRPPPNQSWMRLLSPLDSCVSLHPYAYAQVFLHVLNKSQSSLHQEVYHSSHPEANDRSLQVFLHVLNKSQSSLHQEVYHSSHPEANDRSLQSGVRRVLLVNPGVGVFSWYTLVWGVFSWYNLV
ncbi:UNVERIFIED_CONTAM: hypothetical protein FKN15_006674 [Acipenser sinensis]